MELSPDVQPDSDTSPLPPLDIQWRGSWEEGRREGGGREGGGRCEERERGGVRKGGLEGKR